MSMLGSHLATQLMKSVILTILGFGETYNAIQYKNL